MVKFNLESADVEATENVNHNAQEIGIWDHWAVASSDVKITLVELTEATSRHLRGITSVDLGDVVSLDGRETLLSDVPSEGHGKIVAERE